MKKLLFIIFILSMIFALSVKVHAVEDNTETGGEVIISSGTKPAQESDLQKQLDKEEESVAILNNAIIELQEWSEEDVTRDMILELHDRYEALSTAAKTKVENYELVLYYIDYLRLEFPEPTEETGIREDKGKKIDDHYVLSINNDSVSVTVHYAMDHDSDGIPEVPGISLVSPKGAEYELREGTTAVENAEISLSVSWEEKFMQMDIFSAENGIWQIKTDDVAVFNAFPYAGQHADVFTPETESGSGGIVPETGVSEEQNENKKDATLQKAIVKLVLTLVITGLVITGICYGAYRLLHKGERDVKDRSSRRKSGRRKKEKEEKYEEDDDDDDDDEMFEDDWDEKEKARRKLLKERENMKKFLDKRKKEGEDQDSEAADEEDRKRRDEIKNKEQPKKEEAPLEESSEYPSGMISDTDTMEDKNFGNKF